MPGETQQDGPPTQAAQAGAITPISNGTKRDEKTGRWLPGTKGGPGNPMAKQVAELRKAMLSAVTPELMVACIRALLAKAIKGDVSAIKEVMDRTLGKPIEADLLERIESLEAMLEEKARHLQGGQP